jgi:hypothetical protein
VSLILKPGGLSGGSEAQNAVGQLGDGQVLGARIRQVSGAGVHQQEDGEGIRFGAARASQPFRYELVDFIKTFFSVIYANFRVSSVKT